VGDSVPVSVEVTQEDPQAMVAIIRRYLAAGDRLGIYDSGWESAEIADVLRGLPVRPRWIAHECSPLHQQWLREGLLDFVLDQSPEAQVRCALHHMLAHSGDAQGRPMCFPCTARTAHHLPREHSGLAGLIAQPWPRFLMRSPTSRITAAASASSQGTARTSSGTGPPARNCATSPSLTFRS
jgi:hypothetical protein